MLLTGSDRLLNLVQWFSLECIVLTQTGILASVQNASGRPGERLAVALVAGSVRWGLAYGIVARFGLAGIGYARPGGSDG